jgi:AraC family transcriptional regulator
MQIMAETEVRGIEVRELVYGNRPIPRHAHAMAGFCLVLDGTYEERYGSHTLACSARTVTFSPAGAEHANVFSAARSHCLTIDMPEPLVERLERGVARMREPFETRGGTLAWLAERLLREVRGGGDGAELIVEGVVLEMLGEAARGRTRAVESHATPAMQRAYDLLHARYAEPLSLADLAAATERHPVYIATAFRQTYGETVGECLRRLRVEHACRALTSSAAPLAEIALASGFANQSHFTRVFKTATGLTPLTYRPTRAPRQT